MPDQVSESHSIVVSLSLSLLMCCAINVGNECEGVWMASFVVSVVIE